MLQNNSSSDWNQYPLKLLKTIKYSTAVLMGEYLVMIVHGNNESETRILAYCPRDNKVQEAPTYHITRSYYREFPLNKYKDNQIIRSEGFRLIVKMTIKSFDRIITF